MTLDLKKYLQNLIFVSFLFTLNISWSLKPEGIYVFGSNNSEKASGTVSVHKTSESIFLFYFEYNVGGPSYNSDAQYGYLRHLEKCTFENHWDNIENRIEFAFDSNYSTVTLYGKLRGMVTYKKKSEANPEYFVNRKGQKTYFSKTKPEDYTE